MNAFLRPASTLASLLLALAALPALASGSGGGGGGGGGTEIVQFLASTGADADATCRARWRQDASQTRFDVELEHLAAGDYELWVAGAQHGSVSVDALGQGETEFVTPQDGVKPLFDFEVLDQVIEIRQGPTSFFSDSFSSTGAGGGGGGGSSDTTKTEMQLVNVGPDADAHGSLRYEAKPGQRKFSVRVEDLTAGTYQILVAGAPVGEIVAAGAIEVEVEFQDPVEPGKVLLNFDPLGAQVDVAAAGITYFSAVLPASNTAAGGKAPSGKKAAEDKGKHKGDALAVALLNSGVIPGASGKASFSKSGESELEVEIEHLPDGDYGFAVGGTPVATISVVSGAGQVAFSTSPAAGQLLLDFDVQGQLLAVSSGTDTILSVVFPLTVQAALGSYKHELHAEDHVRINLAGTGADLDARGTADFRHRTSHDTLTIKVQDLAAGSYDVLLAGEVQAGVLVVDKADGSARVVFDTQPKGSKLLLDVAVTGALVQITPAGDAATVLLSGTIE